MRSQNKDKDREREREREREDDLETVTDHLFLNDTLIVILKLNSNDLMIVGIPRTDKSNFEPPPPSPPRGWGFDRRQKPLSRICDENFERKIRNSSLCFVCQSSKCILYFNEISF